MHAELDDEQLPKDSRPVLVTGASGFLGPYLLRELHRSGYAVQALGRRPEALRAALQPGQQFLIGDLEQLATGAVWERASTRGGPAPQAIIHAAALSSPWGRWHDFQHTNITGTAHVIDYLRKKQVPRLVFVSSPSVYAARRDRLNIVEDDVDQKNRLNHYIRSKIAAENFLTEAHEAGDIPELIIIRPRGLIGAGDTSLLPRLLRANDRTGIPLFDGGRNLVDVTAVHNVALALRLAVDFCPTAPTPNNPFSQPLVFNISNGDPRGFKELLDQVLDQLGIQPRYREATTTKFYRIAGVLENAFRLVPGNPEPPLTRYTVSTIAHSQTLDITRARQVLGYEPQVSIEQAIAEFVACYRTKQGSEH